MLKKIGIFINYVVYIIIIIVFSDMVIFNKFLGYGYPHYFQQENLQRYPAPYVMFKGKPNALDHNEFGFRGKSFLHRNPDAFSIAFFGGSTGYFGDPPIAVIIEKELTDKLKRPVAVNNFSVVSSNHRQHLHGILEYASKSNPDMVIFYGGFNETVQTSYYDPRPGYPFNYFYQAETSAFRKFLIANSAIIGELDKRFGIISGKRKLQRIYKPFSQDWNEKIVANYFETLALANNVSHSLKSKHCKTPSFYAFYQPYPVPKRMEYVHNSIVSKIKNIDYAYDFSHKLDSFGKDIFTDWVHIKQNGRVAMGKAISELIYQKIMESKNNSCQF